jgi:hypothetical protein
MTAQVFSFFRRPAAPRDWSTQELAEFYRVEAALIQAGLSVVSERGLTDEGEPWFVFCREEDDEVIIHFARLDGRYLISAPGYCGTAMGRDFRSLARATIERHPILQPRPKGDNLFLHPAALLIVLVASALLKSGHAAATEPTGPVAAETNGNKHRDVVATTAMAGEASAQHETLILTAISAVIGAPVQAESVPVAPSPPVHTTDFVDQSLAPPASHGLLDVTPDTAPHDSGSVISDVAPRLVVAAPVTDLSSLAAAHAPPSADTASGPGVPGFVTQIAPPSMTLPASPVPDSLLAPPHSMSAMQALPLAAVSGIPKVELDLLHALHAPEIVPFSASLPAAFSTVLQAGVHTVIAHPDAAQPESTGAAPAASAAQSAAGLTTSPAMTSVSTTTTAPATPDMKVVLVAVEQFQAVAVQTVLMMTPHAAIFYDAAATTMSYGAVTSVTYDFGDGFSISLVGLPSELPHAAAHM